MKLYINQRHDQKTTRFNSIHKELRNSSMLLLNSINHLTGTVQEGFSQPGRKKDIKDFTLHMPSFNYINTRCRPFIE